MAISFDQQYFVEKDRNNKYEWLIFVVTFFLLGLHGALFHWIPMKLRQNRSKHDKYFKFLKFWDIWTSCVNIKGFYFQPSLLLLGVLFAGINVLFCFLEINDIDYQPKFYVMSKRISKVAVGSLPFMMFSVAKHDILTNFTGLQHDRLEFLHKWLARLMWVMITIHMIMAMVYWLNLNFVIMIQIPPQIFGFIAYGSFCVLTWASVKFIRQLAYDFFLVQHRVFAFIMLSLSFFHNAGNRAAVLIAVHGLVIDRVVSKVMAHIHAAKSPTKGRCDFKILDNDTIAVWIPVSEANYVTQSWYTRFLPAYKTWKAGQHIYFNVSKIKFFQYHPFTIASIAETGKMKLLIRVQKGFTRQLMRHLEQVDHDVVTIKGFFHGPYGARMQPLIPFDVSLFFAAGSGGAFTFPVCLDLLNQLEKRDDAGDFLFRPSQKQIRFIWSIKKLDNLCWFEDELKALTGRCIIDIYVTQESKIESSSSDDDYQTSESDTSNLKDSVRPVSVSKSSINEITRQTSNDYTIHYGRPDISSIIEMHSTQLCPSQSVSVCSCGAPSFTNSVKESCQKARKLKNSPDVYCYTESF
ncbi:Ferric reductase transmembrane component 5 [Candida tropicalis]